MLYVIFFRNCWIYIPICLCSHKRKKPSLVLSLQHWKTLQIPGSLQLILVQSCKSDKSITCQKQTTSQWLMIKFHLWRKLFKISILCHIWPLAGMQLDLLQFTYCPEIRKDDAFIYLLYRFQNPGSTVKVVFFDFFNFFSKIQLALLRDKLEGAGVDVDVTAWAIDYTSSSDHSMWGFRIVCLKWWYVARGVLRWWCSLPSSLHSLHWTMYV